MAASSLVARSPHPAALAGVGWTLSASELWVAAQRAMPDWARGRMNATVIMISQGAMALGGVIWGWTAAIAGSSYTLLGAAVLFLTTLLLTRRLSINFAESLAQRVSGPRAPLIFKVPAYGFVMALHPDWLDRSNGARFSTKTFAQEVEPVHPVRPTSDGSDATPVLTRIYDKVPSPRTAIL
jgi:hypothetical protein